jgi:ankyrin repeat protein
MAIRIKQQQQETTQLAAIVSYVNMQDTEGRTALHHGAINGHMDIVALLMENGADARITDKFGESAADVARNNGHDDVYEFIISYHM